MAIQMAMKFLVEGEMSQLPVNYDNLAIIPPLNYSKKGHDFMGWVIEGDVLPSYGDQASFTYKKGW